MSIIEKALDKLESKLVKTPDPIAGRTPAPKMDAAVEAAKAPSNDSRPIDPTDLSPAEATPPEKPKTLDCKKVSIDWDVLRKHGMLLPDASHRQMAEEYRLIKRPLLMNAFPESDNGIAHRNLILVTSSLPGEGKTFSAINLALSIAMERDKTVLLVDADVAKPSVSRALGLKTDDGLIELLENKDMKFQDVMLKTDIPNLNIIPAGRQHRHSTELLASDAMKKLARELSARYSDRIVIFDSPPLLAATQGSVLAHLVGQIVLVVEAEVTPQYIVKESIAKLDGCEVVGCLLNKIKKGLGFQYYSYYGYYGRAEG